MRVGYYGSEGIRNRFTGLSGSAADPVTQITAGRRKERRKIRCPVKDV